MKNKVLKYRAFYEGKMYQVGEIRFEAKEVCLWNGKGSAFNFIDTSKVELMQFTGFKDCNGVEIYEGDIIELNLSTLTEAKRYYVVFEKGAFFLYHTKNEYGRWGAMYKIMEIEEFYRNIRIIGNIYENKNLIKQ